MEVEPVPCHSTESEQRGRPRDSSIEDRVIEAAAEELAENGFGGFSVRAVARRSGVSRPSLLLRWRTRDELIVETVQRATKWPSPDPDAPFREELEGIVARIVELLQPDSIGIHLRLVVDAPRYPGLFAAFRDTVMTKAATQLSTLLRRGVAEGELPQHIDFSWAADALVGVLMVRSLAMRDRNPLSPSAQRRIIDTFLKTLGSDGT
jgi:AcrR family transcriptional regulator